MIHIVLVCTKEDELVSCEAKGHALFSKKGDDIVCAAVSTLLRTTLAVLEGQGSFDLETLAPSRGTLLFRIQKKIMGGDVQLTTKSSLLIYAKVFLEKGLKTLCNEYPEHVSLELNIEEGDV